jgi:asparagine synthetase B (glutamine-hydrolysing)
MNGKGILKLIAVVGLAKLVMGSHRHRMGPRQRGNWHDHIAELHRELHRSDAEANAQPIATPSADAT